MPRQSRERGTGTEASLAKRVEFERKEHGLSHEALAKKMTDAGCKIQGSAIYKIEKADPPRRITVDELTAFAEVFTDGDVKEMLKTVEDVERERASEMAQEWIAATVALDDAHAGVVHAAVRLGEIARSAPEVYESIAHTWLAAAPGRQWFGDPEFNVVDEGQLAQLAVLGSRFWERALDVIDNIAQKNGD